MALTISAKIIKISFKYQSMEPTLALPLGLRLVRRLDFPRKLGILQAIYGSMLSSKGTQWVQCYNGVVWKLDLTEPSHRWIVFGYYEGGLGINLAKKALANGGVFIDSGANIGQWVLYLGSIPGLRALEFEPVESQRLWLHDCVACQPGWHSKVKVLSCGLGSKQEILEIQCDGARSTLRDDWYTSKKLTREQIMIRKLDDVLTEECIDIVQFWKLDVEGAEYDALLGAKSYLERNRIMNLYFECHPTNYRRNKEFLEACGYRLYDVIDSDNLRAKTDSEIACTQNLFASPVR
ncbi:MAG: FkbM family methyltransferase [Cyanobium sp.]